MGAEESARDMPNRQDVLALVSEIRRLRRGLPDTWAVVMLLLGKRRLDPVGR